MILRQSALRLGRRAISSPVTHRPWQPRLRTLATDIDATSSSLDHAAQETRSIEAMLNAQSSSPILPFEEDVEDESGGPGVAETYAAFKKQQSNTANLGTAITGRYRPHTLLSNPPSPKDITLELLLASQAHLGHSTSLWNPSNQRYIFGIRQGIHIISLDITAAYLRRACKVVSAVCARGGLVLFVGTRAHQHRCVVSAAKLASGCHLFDRWIPGSITNGQQILGKLALRVVDQFDNPLPEYDDQLVDQPVVRPDLVVCLNPLENYILLQECGQHNIPTIGIIDTDADPTWVTYPIPANDDSLRCVQLIAGTLGRAGQEGQGIRREKAEKGEITYFPSANLVNPSKAAKEAVEKKLRDDLEEGGEGPVQQVRAGGAGRRRGDDEEEDDG